MAKKTSGGGKKQKETDAKKTTATGKRVIVSKKGLKWTKQRIKDKSSRKSAAEKWHNINMRIDRNPELATDYKERQALKKASSRKKR